MTLPEVLANLRAERAQPVPARTLADDWHDLIKLLNDALNDRTRP